MNTRRKFFLNGSLAALGILAIEPIESFGKTLNTISDFSTDNSRSLVLAHTGKSCNFENPEILDQLSGLRSKHPNLVLIHAGDNESNIQCEASLYSSGPASIIKNEYRIVNKGGIKIGIISVDNDFNANQSANDLAIYLKESKNCQLVVCLSQLGFKSVTGDNDDITLALASSHIDIIVGGNETNYSNRPYISLNKNKEEVIINHAGANGLAMNSLEIGFSRAGKKNFAKFSKLS